MAGDKTLHAVLDSLDTVLLGCDVEGHPVLANEAARGLFGELLSIPISAWHQLLEVTDPAGRRLDRSDLAVLRVLRGERVRGAEIVLRQPDTRWRSFRVNAGPVAGTGPVATVIALHETTMQRRATRLKNCELQISDLLSRPEPADTVMTAAVALIGGMLEWAAVEFWALDPIGQVLRRSICWAGPAHGMPCVLPDQLSQGEGLAGRAWQVSKPRWITDLHTDTTGEAPAGGWGTFRSALAVPIPSGAATLGVLLSYSDLRESPDDMRIAVMTGIAAHLGEFLERRRAEQVITELDRTRDDYIALVGHELRTPLTSIHSCTDLLRSEPDLAAEDREHLLEVMHRNTTALHSLVAKLLDVAGTRAGHLALQPSRMNLTDVITVATDHARAKAAVTFTVNTPPEMIIDGDPERLRQAIGELISNACTWAPEGSTVGITAHIDAHTAVVAVSNTGPRIAADERDRIFDLFYRAGTARTNGIPGAGLGLTHAQAIVEQHGGAITVSEPDEVLTTFTVRLPV